MKYKVVCLASLIFTVGLFPLLLYAQTESASSIRAADEVSLSTAEQDMLTEINQARLHPADYVSYLEELKPLFKGKEYTPKGGSTLMTNEGWDAVEDAIRFLRGAKPQPALTISRGLCLAALAHVKDQSSTGAIGHRGANNGFIEERLKAYGAWQGGVGENLSYGNESARERVLAWLIDDGVSSRGHRVRLLSPDYKVAGLSCGPHPQFGTMCVITLAEGFMDLKTATTTEAKPTASAPTNAADGSQTSPATTTTQTKTAPNSQTKPASTQKPKTRRTARRL